MDSIRRFDVAPRISTSRLREIAASTDAEYTLIYTGDGELEWVDLGLERLLDIARDSSALMLYSDRFVSRDGKMEEAPVIDWQEGALRDDFDFGGVQLYLSSALREAVAYALAKGAILVSAVGNQNAAAPECVYYPAAYDGVIGVGAADGEQTADFRAAVAIRNGTPNPACRFGYSSRY